MKEQSELVSKDESLSRGFMFLCYLFIIATIVSADVLWVKVLPDQVYRTYAQYFYVCMIGVIIFIYYYRNRLKTFFSLDTGLMLVTVLTLLCGAVTYEDSFNAYLFKIAMIIGGYFGVRLFKFDCFYQAFRRIMLVFMAASLLLYIMKLTGIGYAALPVNQISNGIQYSTIGLANIYNNSFYDIPRAQSIFWEPGVYAAYLIILLLFELFYREKLDAKYFIIVLVSIATTLSTTGYLVAMLVLIAYTLLINTGQHRKKMIVTILLVIFFLVIVLNENILFELTSKITDRTESFKNRWLSIVGNIIVINRAPIFGLGPSMSQDIIESYIRSQGGVKSFNNLNTILANYSIFGLASFLYYVYHLIKFCFSFNSSKIGKTLILCAVVLLLSSTGYQYSPFFTIVFMYRLEDNIERDTVI